MTYATIQPPEALCRLPQFRPVALKLLTLVSSDDVDFKAIARLLSSDPAFSAEVLALANSPLYCGVGPAASLTRAIVVLGLERTRSLALTVAMQAFVGNIQTTVELQNSWRHSVACALIAEQLAPGYGISRDHGYTTALMHDVGRLGLLKAYPQPYAEVLKGTYETAAEVLDAERQWFQADHCQSGLWLTRSWGLPEEFQDVTSQHHTCRVGREHGVVGLTAVACLLADALGFPSVNYRAGVAMEELIGMAGQVDLEELRERIVERLAVVDGRS